MLLSPARQTKRKVMGKTQTPAVSRIVGDDPFIGKKKPSPSFSKDASLLLCNIFLFFSLLSALNIRFCNSIIACRASNEEKKVGEISKTRLISRDFS